ncbi:MAG: carbon-nitrogen hydrolase family protein [Verrucomicrobiota bacterium]
MKIAIIQPLIKPNFLDTVEGQLRQMEQAAQEGAELIILPELATTGFTGKIAKKPRAQVTTHITETIDRFRQWVLQKGIALSFGSVLFPEDESERPSNVMLTFLPDGSEYRDDKVILMKGREEEFFKAGENRSGFHYKGLKFDFIICCEFMDLEQAARLISPDTDIVLWPGAIRHNAGKSFKEDMSEEKICSFAMKHGVQVVRCNWANFLDAPPDRPGNMGGSYAMMKSGKVSVRCNWDSADEAIIRTINDSPFDS